MINLENINIGIFILLTISIICFIITRISLAKKPIPGDIYFFVSKNPFHPNFKVKILKYEKGYVLYENLISGNQSSSSLKMFHMIFKRVSFPTIFTPCNFTNGKPVYLTSDDPRYKLDTSEENE